MDELRVGTSPSSLILRVNLFPFCPIGKVIVDRGSCSEPSGREGGQVDRCSAIDISVPAARPWMEAMSRRIRFVRGREADAQPETKAASTTEAASTAFATLPTWMISTLWGLACSATGMVIVSTPSW